MKYLFAKTIAVLLCMMASACNALADDHDTQAFEKFLLRIMSQHASHFRFKYIPAENEKDVFEISDENGFIMLKGNNNNSLAVALNYYLKYYCYTTVTWYVHDSIQLPRIMSAVGSPIKQKAKVKDRFFLNYCTFGYTFPWWQWKDWERLIDWMSMNGINLPLAITGQEAIWYKVWENLGLTDIEIRSYFTGPAHLPWNRMSNIDKWQGPLPMSYIENQLALQKLIIQREREFNMKPVLPAFSGHVPEILKSKYHNAKITELGEWSAFPEQYRSYFLDPFDPLFNKIQQIFLEEQNKEFGSDHIYGIDPFNEVTPPSWEPSYLASVSKEIYASLSNADSSAKWLMMTWIFYFQREHWTNERIKAFVRAVPQGKILLLDYYAEDTEVWKFTESFYGQPYLWCYLGNFGGNTMLAGDLSDVSARLSNTFRNGGNNLAGVGSTLEGLNPNAIMYDYIFERAWTSTDTSLSTWINNWAYSRAGKKDTKVAFYWNLMVDSIYTATGKLGQGTLINSRPALTGFGNWTTNPTINYSNTLLFKIWKGLGSVNSERITYHHDLVNIGRQFLGNYFSELRDGFNVSYQNKDVKLLHLYGKQMLEMLDDMNELISADGDLSLYDWLNDAQKFGKDENERKYYEENAKVILTTWSGKNHMLNDYANRSWSGLISEYYKTRWAMFISDVIDCVEKRKLFDDRAFVKKVTDFEWNWTQTTLSPNIQQPKNGQSISNKLIKKYERKILSGK